MILLCTLHFGQFEHLMNVKAKIRTSQSVEGEILMEEY